MTRSPQPWLGSGRLLRFALLLLSVDALDELASGVPGSAAPGIQEAFATSHAGSGALLTAFGLLSLVLEPPLFLLADRYPRRWFTCGGLLGLGLSCFLAASAPSYWVLFVALLLFGPTSGCGVTLSQATLVDSDPANSERWLTRWVLAGSLGDLATPGLLAVVYAAGLGWRTAFAACGLLACIQALTLWRQRFPDETKNDEEEDDDLPWRESLRLALTNRRLLLWSLGLVTCTLLDETLFVFATLRMSHDLGFSDGQVLTVVACFSTGAVATLVGYELLPDRILPLRLLGITSLLSLGAHVGFVLAESFVSCIAWALLSGIGIAMQYPLAKAQLYRCLPGRSGTAVAVAGLFAPLDLALPILVGMTADTWGLAPALFLLLAQPASLLALSLLGPTAGDSAESS
ncbi:MAG: MFS transporter [Acidobacteriota bacterium]